LSGVAIGAGGGLLVSFGVVAGAAGVVLPEVSLVDGDWRQAASDSVARPATSSNFDSVDFDRIKFASVDIGFIVAPSHCIEKTVFKSAKRMPAMVCHSVGANVERLFKKLVISVGSQFPTCDGNMVSDLT
jgi:hypothetical protein